MCLNKAPPQHLTNMALLTLNVLKTVLTREILQLINIGHFVRVCEVTSDAPERWDNR